MWIASLRSPCLYKHVRKDFCFRSKPPKRPFRPSSSGALENGSGPPGRIPFGSLVKPFLFTVGFSGVTLAGVSIWQYENMRGLLSNQRALRDLLSFKTSSSSSSKYGSLRQEINRLWNNLSPGEKVFLPIFCLNLAVTILWQIKRFNSGNLLRRYFLSDPGSPHKSLPLLLSSFSHLSILHFGVNMFVLHSFCEASVRGLGKEQFVGVYLMAGVVSGFTSLTTKILLRRTAPSLGASGCICAVLGVFGSLNPGALMQIVFLPGFTFTASTAIKGLIALDAAGIVLGWRFFDHAAHLGGTLFGVWWATYGGKLIWQKRQGFVTWWHENVRRK